MKQARDSNGRFVKVLINRPLTEKEKQLQEDFLKGFKK